MATSREYNQMRAMLAITKASLRSTFRSPSAVVFSFLFPLIFIVVFGFLDGGHFTLDMGVSKKCDTTNQLFQSLKNVSIINLIRDEAEEEMMLDLNKGRIDGILEIHKGDPALDVIIHTSDASQNSGLLIQTLQSVIDESTLQMILQNNPQQKPIAEIHEDRQPGRIYRTIDFILPGMLGFSLLSTGVFGVAFVFLNLRNTLVIKRFFATPIHRTYIVLGEALSRVLFALVTSSVIIVLGYFAFHFTLVHGFHTFLNILVLCFIGLFVFMGFGFVISGLAKNESAVPPLANIVTLPQFLLAGTFFSTSNFPSWLQPVTKVLPLTYLNHAMRRVSFEGATLIQVSNDLLILGIWAVVIYFFAVRVFKWE